MPAKPHPPRCPTCRKIRAAHKAGTTGRNEIAKQLGIAAASVTAHAKHAGITFDRAMTAQAVAARSIDLAAARQDIKQRLYLRAQANLARLEAPAYRYRIVTGGEYASSETVEDEHPPAASEKDHAASITQYVNTAIKLEQVDAGRETGAAISLLDTLAHGFAQAAADYTPPESP